MKERIQHTINQIRTIAGVQNNAVTITQVRTVQRPQNNLSQSIRNEKDANQFKAELKAAVALGKTK